MHLLAGSNCFLITFPIITNPNAALEPWGRKAWCAASRLRVKGNFSQENSVFVLTTCIGCRYSQKPGNFRATFCFRGIPATFEITFAKVVSGPNRLLPPPFEPELPSRREREELANIESVLSIRVLFMILSIALYIYGN